MAVKIGSARSSYGNTAPGDQNGGKEVSTENWYLHSKGWVVLRAIDPAVREQLQLAEKNEELRNAVNKARKESGAVDQCLRMVRETTCPDVLTPELVGNLIDRVEVGETYMEGDVKKQDIRILFNFIDEVD